MGESQNWSTMNLKTKIISMRVIHILLIKVQIDFHKPQQKNLRKSVVFSEKEVHKHQK